MRRKKLTLRPIHPRRSAEAAYRRILSALLKEMQIDVKSVSIRFHFNETAFLHDSPSDDILEVLDSLKRAFERFSQKASTLVEELFYKEEERHRKRFDEAVNAAIGIDLENVFSTEFMGREVIREAMNLRLRENVSLIKNISNEMTVRIERTLLTAFKEGVPPSTLAKQLSKDFKFRYIQFLSDYVYDRAGLALQLNSKKSKLRLLSVFINQNRLSNPFKSLLELMIAEQRCKPGL